MVDKVAIRAGDTVTVRVEKGYSATPDAYTIQGIVYHLNPLDSFLMIGPLVLEQENITLIDHQPAPAAEPGLYVVYPKENPGARWSGVIDNNGDFHGEEDGFYRAADEGYYTVVSRLVALDPATARKSLEDDGWDYTLVDEILRTLRIEEY